MPYEHLVHEITPETPLPPALVGRRIDAALLLAWPVDPAIYLQSPDNLKALAATLAIGQALLVAGCTTIVGVGTCAEYAPPENGMRLLEDHALKPDTLYAACKAAVHPVLTQLGKSSQATITWARIFNSFGPGEPASRLLPSIARACAADEPFLAGSGAQVRDYLHVDDIATGLATCLNGGLHGPVNICSGRPLALAEVMRFFAKACSPTGRITFGAKPDRTWDPPIIVGDPGRLLRAGWQPREPLTFFNEYARALMSADQVGRGGC